MSYFGVLGRCIVAEQTTEREGYRTVGRLEEKALGWPRGGVQEQSRALAPEEPIPPAGGAEETTSGTAE